MVRLNRDGVNLAHTLRARFERKFGRAPEPGDPVFLDVMLDVLAPVDQPRFDAAIVAAMEAAGVDGALIHAYRRTGLLVSEHNVAGCSPGELQRWQAALDEYDPAGFAGDHPLD